MANLESRPGASARWRQSGGMFVREWLPAGAARGGILCVHGMESHSGWFKALAGRLAGLGWAVTAYDRPGWGKSSGPSGHLYSYKDFIAGLSAMAEQVRDAHGSAHLAGMSWGGMGCLYFALRRGWLADSLCLLAPGLAVREGLPAAGIAKLGLALATGRRYAQFDPGFTPETFTDDPDSRAFIASDPLRVGTVSAAFCVETIKMRRFIDQHAGRRQTPPVLCLLGGNDRMLDNAKAACLCRRAGATVEVLDGAGHALALECPDEVARRLANHAERSAGVKVTGRRRVWVVGGGAVGGAVGSLLAFAGHETGVLVKPRHVDALGKDGFVLSSPEAARPAGRAMTVAAEPAGLPEDPDLVIVAVKSFDTVSALMPLRGAIPPGAVVVSLQNGLANEEAIVAALPGRNIAAGAICASLESPVPGRILWADDRGGIGTAAYAGDADRIREAVECILPATGMECLWVDGPRAALRLKWSKLLLNAGFNALNSLTGLSSAAILADRRNGRLAIDAIREGFRVMKRLSLAPVDLPGYPVAKLGMLVKAPTFLARRIMAWQAGRSPEAAFSMRQDVLKHRGRTEIAELNGAIAKQGEALGVKVPANLELCRLVQVVSQ